MLSLTRFRGSARWDVLPVGREFRFASRITFTRKTEAHCWSQLTKDPSVV